MEENICKCAQTKNAMDNINILNFVYEKKAEFKQAFIIPASYSMSLVTEGVGVLHTKYGDFRLSKGSLFFTFSTKPYYIENKGELQFVYISFIGRRASGLLERLNISGDSPVYDGFSFLCEHWLSDFEEANEYNIDLVCEGLLLHSLSYLCKNMDEKIKDGKMNAILSIKQYVDLHYTEIGLDLKSVSTKFNYSSKYVSAAFVKMVKVSFSDYIRDLRMKHAETLLKGGLHSIREVAMACGYSDPLYFSKSFKKYFGMSPKNYIKTKIASLGQ